MPYTPRPGAGGGLQQQQTLTYKRRRRSGNGRECSRGGPDARIQMCTYVVEQGEMRDVSPETKSGIIT